MNPEQLEKKLRHYRTLLAQVQDGSVTLAVQLEEALAETEQLRTELAAAKAKAAEVPAAEEDNLAVSGE